MAAMSSWLALVVLACLVTGTSGDMNCTISGCASYLVEVPFGEQACTVINDENSCVSHGLVDVLTFAFCDLGNSKAIVTIVLLLYAAFLFITLGSTADSFLCPNLITLSDNLSLPGHIAGVTLLAFGNGAPDLFSAYSAIRRGPQSASMAFGALFGAGTFVASAVVGLIAIVGPFHFNRRPLFRDVSLFALATAWSMYVLRDGKIDVLDSIGFIVLYVLYVLLVIVGHKIYRTEFFKEIDPLQPLIPRPNVEKIELLDQKDEKKEPVTIVLDNAMRPSLLGLLNPIDLEDWRSGGRLSKIILVICAPIVVSVRLTCPTVHLKDGEVNTATWSKFLLSIQIVLGSLFALVNVTSGKFHIETLLYVLAAACVLSGVVLIFASSERPFRHYRWISFFGFVMAVFWIMFIADQAVECLAALGLVLGASDAVIGLVVLGLGNSVGDLVANVVVARQGHSTMAASACYGAPALNILLGIGVSYLSVIIESGSENVFECIDDEKLQLIVSGTFLLVILFTTCVVTALRGYYADKWFGGVLIFLYIASLITAIVLEQV